jgi:hypothetical protein
MGRFPQSSAYLKDGSAAVFCAFTVGTTTTTTYDSVTFILPTS